MKPMDRLLDLGLLIFAFCAGHQFIDQALSGSKPQNLFPHATSVPFLFIGILAYFLSVRKALKLVGFIR